MATTETYTQCSLIRQGVWQVAWIPSRYAKPGKTLRLRKDKTTWETGWHVYEVFSTLSADAVVAADRLAARMARNSCW